MARIIREDYLQQNGYSPYDRYCPFYKTVWMLRNIVTFYNLARKAVDNTSGEHRITWSLIRQKFGGKDGLLHRLSSQKFKDPADGEDTLRAYFAQLKDDIEQGFATLDDAR